MAASRYTDCRWLQCRASSRPVNAPADLCAPVGPQSAGGEGRVGCAPCRQGPGHSGRELRGAFLRHTEEGRGRYKQGRMHGWRNNRTRELVAYQRFTTLYLGVQTRRVSDLPGPHWSTCCLPGAKRMRLQQQWWA